VSAVGRRTEPNQQISGFTDYIQTDAAINQGNSGGALVNLSGDVIGINSWIASPNGGSIGIGFAIPINIAANAISQFIEKGHIDYGWLGVTIGDVDNDMRNQLKLGDEAGAFIYGVIKDSPAKKNGIQPGDYIISVGGQSVTDASGLTWMIGNMNPGDNDVINLIRYGENKSVDVKITARPDEQTLEQQSGTVWPGIAVVPVTGDMRDQYNIPRNAGDLIVAGIDNSGSAAVNGMQMGDIITQVGGTNVHSLLDFYKALNTQSGNNVSITVNRGGVEMTLKVAK
jgi:serine protease Do